MKLDGLFIPIEILEDKSLSPSEKLYLSLLKVNGPFKTDDEIASALCQPEASVARTRRSLARKGYI